MRFQLELQRTFPHAIEKVWQALTDAEALGEWLMRTDFVPEVGHEFRMWCDDGQGGTDCYLCQVLALEAPRRMLWSWVLDGRQSEGATTVEFVLEEVAAGTRLKLRHAGDRDEDTVKRFEAGWPAKLDALGTLLGARLSG